MEEIIYNDIEKYFSILEKYGYLPYEDLKPLLLVLMFKDIIYELPIKI